MERVSMALQYRRRRVKALNTEALVKRNVQAKVCI